MLDRCKCIGADAVLGDQGGAQSRHQALLVGEHEQVESGIVFGGEVEEFLVGETSGLADGVHVQEVTGRRSAVEGADLVRDRVGERQHGPTSSQTGS